MSIAYRRWKYPQRLPRQDKLLLSPLSLSPHLYLLSSCFPYLFSFGNFPAEHTYMLLIGGRRILPAQAYAQGLAYGQNDCGTGKRQDGRTQDGGAAL